MQTRTLIVNAAAAAVVALVVAAPAAGKAQPPDWPERAAGRVAQDTHDRAPLAGRPARTGAGVVPAAPDWPERAAARTAAPSDVFDRVQLAALPGRTGASVATTVAAAETGFGWAELGLGALVGALLAGTAVLGRPRAAGRLAHR